MGLTPNISTVVLNYNTRELLKDCLHSIMANNDGLDIQIIVVDNASPDGSAAMVKESFPEAYLIENSENVGFTRGNNQGIEEAEAPYILVLNQDTVIKPGALGRMLRYMESNPRTGIVGPRLVDGAGEYQQSCHYFTMLKARYALLLLLTLVGSSGFESLGLSTNPNNGDRAPAEVDWIYGACMLVRKELFERVGSFDENIFAYGEDMELCYRAHKDGWQVIYVPDAEIIHYGNQSGIQVFGDEEGYRMLRLRLSNLDYFLKKHFNAGHSLIIRLLMGLGSLVIAGLLGLMSYAKGDADTRRRSTHSLNLGLASLASLFTTMNGRARHQDGKQVKR
jgi:GT2 family glycosyltransferase